MVVSSLKTINFYFIYITQLLVLFVFMFLITFFVTSQTISADFLLWMDSGFWALS
jgi:hypothetical protein